MTLAILSDPSASIPVYSDAVVSCYLTRTTIPASLRTPWASIIWRRCVAELEPDATTAEPVDPDQWRTMYLRWTISGRVQAIWPGARQQRKSRADVARMADASLDTRSIALELGIGEDQCPACLASDTSMKHYHTPEGTSRWKHHHGSCGEGGGVVKMVTLILKDAAPSFLSSRCGSQMSAPAAWPVPEVVKVLEDPEEQDEDDVEEEDEDEAPVNVAGEGARLSQTDVAEIYASLPPVVPSPHLPGFEVTDAPLFAIPAHAIVCPVNTAGVMGKGVALAVREAFPGIVAPYKEWCKSAQGVFRYDADRVILCVATKRDWRDPSSLELVDAAVESLRATLATLGPVTVAIPLLGCGEGGLNADDVLPKLQTLATGPLRIVVSTSSAIVPLAPTLCRVGTFAAVRGFGKPDAHAASRVTDRRIDSTTRAILDANPAVATPIRDASGHIRNVQFRFVTPAVQGKFKGKTRFLNSGNPGATVSPEGLPYVYGDPTITRLNRRTRTGALVPILFGEGWGDYHAMRTVMGDDAVTVTALDAAGLPRLLQTLQLPVDRQVRKHLVIPHRDKADKGVSKGLHAGELLHSSLFDPTIPEGCVLAATGHRPQRLLDWSFDRLVNLAVECVTRVKPSRGISGMALGWDMAVAQAFTIAGIPWTAAIPCRQHEARWQANDQQRYHALLQDAAKVHLVTDGPYSAVVMAKRNLWMLENATATLGCWDGNETGGTWHYVKHSTKPLWNVWNAIVGNYVLWDWDNACTSLGVPNVVGLDFNDLLMQVGADRLREYVLSILE